MTKQEPDYYYIDIELTTLKIVGWNVLPKHQVREKADADNVHRVFLTKGQFNKLSKVAFE